jgi:hypothetical protein
MVSVGFSTLIRRDAIRNGGLRAALSQRRCTIPSTSSSNGEPARRLQAPQHIELCVASDGTESVRRARCYRSANDLWMIGDLLHHNRPASRVSEHVYRPAEVLCQCGCVASSNLGPGDIDAHSRPAVGEEHFEAGAGEWPHRAQGHVSLKPGRRVAVVGYAARQVDQRLPMPQSKVGETPSKDTLPGRSVLSRDRRAPSPA